MEKYLDAPPGGMQIPSAKTSFTEMFGGVYWPRASGAGDPKFNAKQSSSANADLFTYYKLQADTGNAIAQVGVMMSILDFAFNVADHFLILLIA